MSDQTLYVVKGTILAPHGRGIAFNPKEIIRNQEQWTGRGLDAALIPGMIKSGFLVPCTMETLPDASNSRLMKAPQAIADMSKMDGKDLGEVKDPDQDAPYNNDSTAVLGYDMKFLNAKDDQQLRDIVKQAIPGVTEGQLGGMSRAQMEDILTSQKGTGTKHVPNTPGGDVVPTT